MPVSLLMYKLSSDSPQCSAYTFLAVEVYFHRLGI